MSEKENNTKTPIAKNDSVKADHEQQKSVSLENAPKTESASKQQENVPKEKDLYSLRAALCHTVVSYRAEKHLCWKAN